MSDENQNLQQPATKSEPADPPVEHDSIEQEAEEGLYGWKFHRGPLLAAVVLTVLFYIFIFFWVE